MDGNRFSSEFWVLDTSKECQLGSGSRLRELELGILSFVRAAWDLSCTSCAATLHRPPKQLLPSTCGNEFEVWEASLFGEMVGSALRALPLEAELHMAESIELLGALVACGTVEEGGLRETGLEDECS